MKDRLTELIRQSDILCDSCGENAPSYCAEAIADYLLENGVIVPPCRVGDTVYVPWSWGDSQAVAAVEVEEIKFYDNTNHFMFFIDMKSDDECFNQSFGGWKIDKSISESVFLTRAEAEQALKGMV